MALVTISPKAADRPYLNQGGEYGNGRTHQADVTLLKIEVDSDKGPGYDYDCEKDSYVAFSFRVVHDEMGTVFVNHHEPMSEGSGSKVLTYLHALSPGSIDVKTGEFDPDNYINLACAIEVKDPVQSKKNQLMYTGNLTNVFGN